MVNPDPWSYSVVENGFLISEVEIEVEACLVTGPARFFFWQQQLQTTNEFATTTTTIATATSLQLQLRTATHLGDGDAEGDVVDC